MTKASDNPFPSMLYAEGTTPSSPSAGQQRLFVRSSDHVLCMVDSSGTVTALSGALTNPMSAVGDMIQGTTAGAPARLAAPLAGKVLTGAGVTTPLVYAYPPGYQFDYVEKTSDTSITATSQATANTIVTGSAVTYDGSTAIVIEFYGPDVDGNGGTGYMRFHLFDGSSAVSNLALAFPSGGAQRWPVLARHRITPSNASHTYSIRADVQSGTGTVRSGSGTLGGLVPAFMRITKA